jgi:hypothetical protein
LASREERKTVDYGFELALRRPEADEGSLLLYPAYSYEHGSGYSHCLLLILVMMEFSVHLQALIFVMACTLPW